jgi:serpin B
MKRLVVPFLCAAAALTAAGDPVAQGLNQFGVGCYRQLAGSGNLIFSPFSISDVLSMALAGARGGTAAEIASVLRQKYPDPQYAGALAALTSQLRNQANSGGNAFLNANGLWVQSGFRLEPDFQHTLEMVYAVPLTPLDFARNLESARAAINSWTGRQTKGKIHELFAAGSLDTRTRLILTSATYFYGKWERPFLTRNTQPAPFKLGPGRKVSSPFMNQTGRFDYGETPTLQILQMRYAGTGLAWDILLPKSEDGLPDLEKLLTSDNLAAWLGEMSGQTVQVTVPKFRAEARFSMREVLSRMGMPSAFGAADFSGIAGRRDLALSDVIHNAFVDVAEEGTEAAAATGAAAVLVSAVLPDKPVVFRADHPFVFVIRDTRSGLILFAGRLTNPVF